MKNRIYRYNLELISNDFTEFELLLSKLELVRYIENPERFHEETAYYKKVDDKFTYYYQFSKIRSRDYSRGSGYLTHGFDFYKGNFHGQMVRGLINYCNLNKNAVILDPFCGSGTTLIEAKLMGFNSIGIDINPIACLNTRVKTELLNTPINKLINNNRKYFNLEYYKDLYPLNGNFNSLLNSEIKDVFYTFLYTRALSDEKYISKNRDKAYNDNYQKILHTLKRFVKLKDEIKLNLGNCEIYYDDCINVLKNFPDNSIDNVITSPPYIDLIDYIENDVSQIANLFSYDYIKYLRKRPIGSKLEYSSLTERLYWQKMETVFRDLLRILKKSHRCIFVIGEYKNMNQIYLKLLKKIGFSIERIIKRDVISYRKTKNHEYVFFLRKN